VDLRAINEKRLLRMIPALAGFYDIVIIDTQPDYNNLVLNAMNAADIIITPVLRDMDSFNTAAFLQKKIALETDKAGSWFITINGYDRQYEDAKGGKQKDYLDMYKRYFSGHLTPSETWFPWTADMNDIKDRNKPLSANPVKGAAHNPRLHQAVTALCGCFIDEDTLPWAETF
jgi:chromosome partitioning protein